MSIVKISTGKMIVITKITTWEKGLKMKKISVFLRIFVTLLVQVNNCSQAVLLQPQKVNLISFNLIRCSSLRTTVIPHECAYFLLSRNISVAKKKKKPFLSF